MSFSLRLRWPACQGDAGNVFPPIMCVFNTSGAKSRRRFVKWQSALNLTGGHALISLLHRRMEGEMKRRMDDKWELVCVHEEIVQINTTWSKLYNKVSFISALTNVNNMKLCFLFGCVEIRLKIRKASDSDYLHLFDELFMERLGSSITETWLDIQKRNENIRLFRSKWILHITRALYHNCP